MEINDWLKNPQIQQSIQPQKLMLLTQLLSQSNMKSKDELIPFFIAASNKANSMGMSFSEKETDVILDVIKGNLSDAEKARVDTIRQLAKMITAKNT